MVHMIFLLRREPVLEDLPWGSTMVGRVSRKKFVFWLAKSGLTSGANMLGELKYQILDFHFEN